MNFNPFYEKPKKIENTIMSFKDMSAKPYDKDCSAYTRVRNILMNGTEFEAVWCKHHFNRHCPDNDARREVALLRRCEQQQQKLLAGLKPVEENLLETTIGYEQLAVDLTAFLAQRAKDKRVKEALDFALLEDFDHLYRYSNLMENDFDLHAENYVGEYTEIMPARPTIAHHRHPFDTVKNHITNDKSDPVTKLDVSIITAAEQQTMNYYMNLGSFYKNQKGRELYVEIGMVEEDHVTQYGSLIDVNATPYEELLMHEYTEAYLYYSMAQEETCSHIKKIYEMLLEQEISHLHLAVKLLNKYEKKDFIEVIGDGAFPEPIKLHENIDYVRKVIAKTVNDTGNREGYIDVNRLPDEADFFKYQKKVFHKPETESAHLTVNDCITKLGKDYRFETKEHPIKSMRDRTCDDFNTGRIKQ